MRVEYILAFLIAFALGLICVPFAFGFIKKIKAQQTILHYVKEHSKKQGTPTMGGLIFIAPAIIVPMLFYTTDYLFSAITIVAFFAYGILGFLDDFIKVHYKQNLGLRPYQKIIGQVGISFIIAVFVYKSVGSDIYIPFGTNSFDIGLFIIPLVMLVYIATVNSVNLIDGLDGLCGSVSANFLMFFAFIMITLLPNFSGQILAEYSNLNIAIFSLLGGLLAFLVLNSHPAKIFMGDTGSLALGGFIASICVLSKQILLLPILGIAYVITALSDIMQVAHYKRTKKRIFKMAPLHHHFQMSGIHENKIVFSYFATTFILNLIVLALYIQMA